MTNLPPSTAEERMALRTSTFARVLADIERLEAVAEAAQQFMDVLDNPTHLYDVRVARRAALRQALAEAGKLKEGE